MLSSLSNRIFIGQYQTTLVPSTKLASPEFQILGNSHPSYHIDHIIHRTGNVKYEESVEISS